MKFARMFFVTCALLFLTACLGRSNSVDAEQSLSNLMPPPASYDIKQVDVPNFMTDMIEVSLHAAMQTLGYTHRRVDPADLYIYASYEQVDFANNAPVRDAMAESGSMVEPQQFIARVNIVVLDAMDEILWQGRVQRLHTVGPGEYMHRGHAANTIATALVELISGEAGDNP